MNEITTQNEGQSHSAATASRWLRLLVWWLRGLEREVRRGS